MIKQRGGIQKPTQSGHPHKGDMDIKPGKKYGYQDPHGWKGYV